MRKHAYRNLRHYISLLLRINNWKIISVWRYLYGQIIFPRIEQFCRQIVRSRFLPIVYVFCISRLLENQSYGNIVMCGMTKACLYDILRDLFATTPACFWRKITMPYMPLLKCLWIAASEIFTIRFPLLKSWRLDGFIENRKKSFCPFSRRD